jgi:hypothetical protein
VKEGVTVLSLREPAPGSIGPGMRYILAMLVVLICVGAQGCVSDKPMTPPDSVLNPRGQ